MVLINPNNFGGPKGLGIRAGKATECKPDDKKFTEISPSVHMYFEDGELVDVKNLADGDSNVYYYEDGKLVYTQREGEKFNPPEE